MLPTRPHKQGGATDETPPRTSLASGNSGLLYHDPSRSGAVRLIDISIVTQSTRSLSSILSEENTVRLEHPREIAPRETMIHHRVSHDIVRYDLRRDEPTMEEEDSLHYFQLLKWKMSVTMMNRSKWLNENSKAVHSSLLLYVPLEFFSDRWVVRHVLENLLRLLRATIKKRSNSSSDRDSHNMGAYSLIGEEEDDISGSDSDSENDQQASDIRSEIIRNIEIASGIILYDTMDFLVDLIELLSKYGSLHILVDLYTKKKLQEWDDIFMTLKVKNALVLNGIHLSTFYAIYGHDQNPPRDWLLRRFESGFTITDEVPLYAFDDEEIMVHLVRENPRTVAKANIRLLRDPAVILKLVTANPNVAFHLNFNPLESGYEEIGNDDGEISGNDNERIDKVSLLNDIVMACPSVLRHTNIKFDEKTITEAIIQDPTLFAYGSPRLRNNEAFILELIERDPSCFQYVDPTMKSNRNIIKKLAQMRSDYLKDADFSDRSLLLEILEKDLAGTSKPSMLEVPFAENDHQIIIAIGRREPRIFKITNFYDENIAMELVSTDGLLLRYFRSYASMTVIERAIMQNGQAIQHVSCTRVKSMGGDTREIVESLIILAIQQDGFALGELTDKLVAYVSDAHKLLLEAVRQNGLVLSLFSNWHHVPYYEYTPSRDRRWLMLKLAGLSTGYDVISAALSQNGHALAHLPNSLKNNTECIKLALMQDPSALTHVFSIVRGNPEFLELVICNDWHTIEDALSIIQDDHNQVIRLPAELRTLDNLIQLIEIDYHIYDRLLEVDRTDLHLIEIAFEVNPRILQYIQINGTNQENMADILTKAFKKAVTNRRIELEDFYDLSHDMIHKFRPYASVDKVLDELIQLGFYSCAVERLIRASSNRKQGFVYLSERFGIAIRRSAYSKRLLLHYPYITEFIYKKKKK